MSIKPKYLVAVLSLILSLWFYFTPHMVVNNMKSAAKAKDAAKLSEYVNYPALKENLKTNLNSELTSVAINKSKTDPFSAMGAAMATMFIDPLINTLVTPEGLSMMMNGDATQARTGNAATRPSDSDVKTSMSYESFDRFVVTATKEDAVEESIDLIFIRDSMFSWKLTGVRLPL